MMDIIYNFNFEEIITILKKGWQDLASTDIYQLKFSETELAFRVGTILLSLIVLKLIWVMIGRWLGRENYSRKDSGHFISGEAGRYIFARLILFIPTLLLAIPLLAIVFAIADPYFPITKEEKKYIETRTRVDLRDVSGSMGQARFKNTGKAKAEIAAIAHLKFLEMRRGKNDRTAFWLFSSDPYPVQEDFTIDEDLYYLKVYDSPWEIGEDKVSSMSEEQWAAYPTPKSRYLYVAGQGGTRLSASLKAVIRLFDDDVKRQKKSPYYRPTAGRSVLMITDAAISDFDNTKDDFQELSKRNIRPYIIFIDENAGEKSEDMLSNISKLLQEVVDRGGKFFLVSDVDAIDKAYQEIDHLEKSRVEIEKKYFKIPAFQKFIFLAIVSLFTVTILGVISELFYYP